MKKLPLLMSAINEKCCILTCYTCRDDYIYNQVKMNDIA